MLKLKPVFAALAIGAAMLMSPGAASAVALHHTPSHATHTIKHKHKKHHHRTHHKHAKTASVHTRGNHLASHSTLKSRTVAVSTHVGSRHHPV